MNISINFLPVERKKEIKNLKYIGVVIKVGIMAVLSLCIFVVFLKANTHIISIEKDVIEGELLRFENSDEYRQTKIAQESLREFNKTAKTIKTGLKSKKDYIGLISAINEMIPEGIIITKFSTESKEIILDGIALERKSFLLLEKSLEESDRFKKVDSPISNIVSETNAKFTFKIELE